MRLGNLAVFLLLLVAVTGAGLMFHYRPAAAVAHADLVDLREVSGLGFLRGLHLWGAYAVVIAVWLHMMRVALRGAYAPPRRCNWSLGVGLMILTLLLAATGYLLRWDQQATWGLAELSPATGARDRIDGSTLLTAYALHCVVLPVVLAALSVVHLRRALRDDAAADASNPGS